MRISFISMVSTTFHLSSLAAGMRLRSDRSSKFVTIDPKIMAEIERERERDNAFMNA